MHVYSGMIQVNARFAPPLAHAGDGVVVRRPRESDAVGSALRNAFAPDQGMPRDFMHSLDAIDRVR